MPVEGVNKVLAALQKKAAGLKKANVEVGYSASYALKIHEDLTLKHPNGMAKFLEIPARTMTAEMAKVVRDRMAAGDSLEDALKAAGELLLAASQKLVPVKTGNLRDSGYVKVTNE